MYRLGVHEFLTLISEGLKTQISEEDIFTEEIKVSHLKRIDKIFNKGLHYYLDPKEPEGSKEASVFFRKQNFVTEDLNIGSVAIVSQFEELRLSLSAIAKLSDLRFERKFPKYTIEADPKEVAFKVREVLYPEFNPNRREFLKSLISEFAKRDVLVFEFVETWNKKNKANIDGFYLKPNMIVLKRHQTFTREIFTLAHELGHYLLDEEEIEELSYQSLAKKDLSAKERWCNDFTYFFLVGEFSKIIDSLRDASPANDYHFDIIRKISSRTHLSQIALFTRLLFQKQISRSNYRNVRNDFEERFRKKQEERDREKQRLKEQGIRTRGGVAKPIQSPLLVSTIQTAFQEGVLNEYEVCKRLNINPEKLGGYLQ